MHIAGGGVGVRTRRAATAFAGLAVVGLAVLVVAGVVVAIPAIDIPVVLRVAQANRPRFQVFAVGRNSQSLGNRRLARTGNNCGASRAGVVASAIGDSTLRIDASRIGRRSSRTIRRGGSALPVRDNIVGRADGEALHGVSPGEIPHINIVGVFGVAAERLVVAHAHTQRAFKAVQVGRRVLNRLLTAAFALSGVV